MSETRLTGSTRGYWVLLLILVLVFIIGGAVVSVRVLEKLERAVVAVERMEKNVDDAMAAAAPLGRELVDKGVDTIRAADAEGLGLGATEGIKDLGRAAKERAMEWLKDPDGILEDADSESGSAR